MKTIENEGVCKEVTDYLDARNPDPETRKAFIEHFHGWSEEKQNEMLCNYELRKLNELRAAVVEIIKPKPTWLEMALSWIGLRPLPNKKVSHPSKEKQP